MKIKSTCISLYISSYSDTGEIKKSLNTSQYEVKLFCLMSADKHLNITEMIFSKNISQKV